MSNLKSQQSLVTSDKNANGKKATVRKQFSTPINVTQSLCAKKKSVPSVQNKFKCTATVASKNLSVQNGKKPPGTKCTEPLPRLLVPFKKIACDGAAPDERKSDSNTSSNTELDMVFIKKNWTTMSDHEKHQSTVNFINKIKDGIMTSYEMLTDFRNSDVLREQLADLSKISSSIIDVLESDGPTTGLKQKLITELHDKEIQTSGVQLDELENSLKNSSEENSRLSTELDAANKNIEQLKRDLEHKTAELDSKSAQDLSLNVKIKESSAAIDNLKKEISAKNEKLNALYEERNKFKYELFDKIKEADKIAEELINEQIKNKKLNSTYITVKSEADELRSDSINNSLLISDKIDEINLRSEEVAHLEKVIAVQNETIDVLKDDIEARSYNTKKLKSKVKWFEETLKSKKNCLIAPCVRDKLTAKIEMLENENKRLQMNIQKLSNTNDEFASEICEHKTELENFMHTKESFLEDQNGVIQLMREYLADQQTGTKIAKETRRRIERVCDDLRDTKDSLEGYEKLMKENWMLKTKNNELKIRLNI